MHAGFVFWHECCVDKCLQQKNPQNYFPENRFLHPTMTTNPGNDYVVKETATLNWTINKFANLTNDNFSSEYFFHPDSEFIFRLCLNPRTTFFNCEQVCIALCYHRNEHDLPMHCKYRVSIVNAAGEKQYTQEYRWNYSEAYSPNNRYSHLNFANFIDHSECINFLVDGNLILNCEVDILNKCPTVLQKDYQSLLESSKFSDTSLLVKEREFKVHKGILAARSKVFEAMFSADLEEKKQNKVEITDIEVEVFEHLLRYIYTGQIPEIDEYTIDLFVAADKYQLDHLKSMCAESLCSNLTNESVVKVLVLADMHNASELKSKCIEHINSNSSAVIATDDWKQLSSRPDLLMQLYEKQSIDNVAKKRRL